MEVFVRATSVVWGCFDQIVVCLFFFFRRIVVCLVVPILGMCVVSIKGVLWLRLGVSSSCGIGVFFAFRIYGCCFAFSSRYLLGTSMFCFLLLVEFERVFE